MADLNTDPSLLSTVLSGLKHLNVDDYVLAFGPEGKHFFATPNGYAANYLPSRILAEVGNGRAARVLWASFGDTADSWFFIYEYSNGHIGLRLGDGAPQALRKYIEDISDKDHKVLLPSVRVQLGANGSFVVWSKTAWACFNVPETLRYHLYNLSAASRENNGLTMGSFKDTTITNVAWHQDGTCFLRTTSNQVGWIFSNTMTDEAWKQLWSEVGIPGGREQIEELAYVAIDAHAPTSTTFAFIKKQQDVNAPFILHFADEPVHARLALTDRRLQVTEKIPSGYFRWATSKRSGRSHPDAWEIELKKGEKMKVWRDLGSDWFLVEGKKGIRGYCHGSWLDFGDGGHEEDSGVAWRRFLKGTIDMMKSAPIKEFPSIVGYLGKCTLAECRPAVVLPGACVHNLEAVLRGSGKYSVEFLKKERVLWHPDRFARFCVPEAAEELKAKAEQLFKVYGSCLEVEERRAGGAQ